MVPKRLYPPVQLPPQALGPPLRGSLPIHSGGKRLAAAMAIKAHTTLGNGWIAGRLGMRSATNVSQIARLYRSGKLALSGQWKGEMQISRIFDPLYDDANFKIRLRLSRVTAKLHLRLVTVRLHYNLTL